MKVIFFGSGEFGLPTLQSLCAGHEVAAVVSQPDRPAGRHRRLTPTPVAAWAEARGLTVHKFEDVNAEEAVRCVAGCGARASVVIAFGQKLGPALIEAMGELAVNLHASLLPKYRGAAPINRAVMDGERETGVSVIGLAQRMDAGPVYAEARTPIDPTETAGELHDRLAALGPEAVGRVLADLEAQALAPREQDESSATRAPKLRKAEGTVGFDQPAEAVRSRVHGLTPWPGCRVLWRRGGGAGSDGGAVLLLRRVSAEPDLSCFVGLESTERAPQPGEVVAGLRVATADGAVGLVELQAPGGKPMPAEAFARGHRLEPGDRLEPVEG